MGRDVACLAWWGVILPGLSNDVAQETNILAPQHPRGSNLKAAEAGPSKGRPCPELGIMPMSGSSLSQASTKVGDDTKDADNGAPTTPKAVKHVVQSATALDIFLFLVAFRILNALTIRTFFQPDEYFQSLEPAWQMAFGKNSGAWITWVSAAP